MSTPAPAHRDLETSGARRENTIPAWLFNLGFCVALLLAIACLAGGAWYLYQFQKGSQEAISAVLASNKDTSQGTQVLSLTAQMYMARILLHSCAITCGMAFGFLGFALFLIGIKSDMDAEGGKGDYKLKIARLSPGAMILVCSMILIGYCAVATLPFDFKQPTGASTGKSAETPRPDLPDDKADAVAKKPL